jgi:hypothetical protein
MCCYSCSNLHEHPTAARRQVTKCHVPRSGHQVVVLRREQQGGILDTRSNLPCRMGVVGGAVKEIVRAKGEEIVNKVKCKDM